MKSIYAKLNNLSDNKWGAFWLALAVIFFFAPVIFGFQSLFEAFPVVYNAHNYLPPQIKTPWVIDSGTWVRTTVPAILTVLKGLSEGSGPLWTPYDGAGEAFLMINATIYQPVKFIYFYLFPYFRAFDWWIILRFFFTGFGAFLFLKSLHLSRRSALLGSIAYMFSGYFFVYITYHFLEIDMLLPYLLWVFEKYFKQSTSRYVAWLGILMGSVVLGGHPQVILISGLFFSSYFLWRIFSVEALRLKIIKHLTHFAVAAILGLAIGAPYIFDLVQNFRGGLDIYSPQINNGLTGTTHGLEHFSPIYLLHLLVSPTSVLEVAIGGHLLDRFVFIIPYVSSLVLLLVLLSLFLKPKPRWLYFFYVFLGFAVLKLVGFPLVNWIGNLPILDKIGWHKLFGPMALALSVIAAWTYDRLANASINLRNWYWLLGSILGIFLAVAFIFPDAFMGSFTPHFGFINRRPETLVLVHRALERLPEIFGSGIIKFLSDGRYFTYLLFGRSLLFALFGIGLITWFARKKNNRAHALFMLWLVLELWLYMPKVRDGFRYFNPYTPPPFMEFLRTKAPASEAGVIATDYTFPVSIGSLFNVRRFQSTSAIVPKRFWYFVPDTIQKNDNDYYKLQPEDVAQTPSQFFDAANLKYLVTESNLAKPAPSFRLVYDKDLKIYENQDVLPRAYVVFQKRTVDSPEAARTLFYDLNFNPRTSVVLEDKGFVPVASSTTPKNFMSAKITSFKNDEVIVQTKTIEMGILVLTDTFFEGWHAYLDSKPVDIYPANIMFRGVELPAGEHSVRFVYEPAWRWPVWLVSWGTIISSLVFALRRKKLKA